MHLNLVRSPDHAGSAEFETAEKRYSVFLSARLETEDNRRIAVRIANLSAGGLMMNLPEGVIVSGAAQLVIRGCRTLAGEIVWLRGKQAGVRFDEPIDPVELIAERANLAVRASTEASRIAAEARQRIAA